MFLRKLRGKRKPGSKLFCLVTSPCCYIELLTVIGTGVHILAKERHMESQIISRLQLMLQVQPSEIMGNEVINNSFCQRQGCTQGKNPVRRDITSLGDSSRTSQDCSQRY